MAEESGYDKLSSFIRTTPASAEASSDTQAGLPEPRPELMAAYRHAIRTHKIDVMREALASLSDTQATARYLAELPRPDARYMDAAEAELAAAVAAQGVDAGEACDIGPDHLSPDSMESVREHFERQDPVPEGLIERLQNPTGDNPR